MGIDAEMLVRGVAADVVTEEWLKEKSFLLAQAIGARHFFLSDGLRADAYKPAYEAWKAAFDAHPLKPEWDAIRRGQAPGEQQAVHARILADIGKPPEVMRLAIDRTLSRYREDDDPAPGTAYYQDGDPILAEPGECLLELSIWGRYYGEGYERGDLLTYCAMAEWLEINIPGCTVYYGGDSSGVLAEPFHAQRRMELRRHLYSEAGRAYFNHELPLLDRAGEVTERPAPCGMCPGGIYRGSRFGYGQDYASYSCAGCGKSVETRDGGKTWQPSKED